MTGVLLARAREVVEKSPGDGPPAPADTTLFIAGHGTGNNENSRQAIERQAELIRARGIYAGVHAVFMEEEPRIAACYELTRTRNIVMVPLFISDGMHCREDIPVLLGESPEAVQKRLRLGEPTWQNPTGKHGKLLWYSHSVGTEPHLADVVLERVHEMAAGTRV
jgi:sirohydrochlorin cobaltochelatase